MKSCKSPLLGQSGRIVIIVSKAEKIQKLKTVPDRSSLLLGNHARFMNTEQVIKGRPLKSCGDSVWNVRVATKKPSKNAQ
jgi:hypothetical protein